MVEGAVSVNQTSAEAVPKVQWPAVSTTVGEIRVPVQRHR